MNIDSLARAQCVKDSIVGKCCFLSLFLSSTPRTLHTLHSEQCGCYQRTYAGSVRVEDQISQIISIHRIVIDLPAQECHSVVRSAMPKCKRVRRGSRLYEPNRDSKYMEIRCSVAVKWLWPHRARGNNYNMLVIWRLQISVARESIVHSDRQMQMRMGARLLPWPFDTVPFEQSNSFFPLS